MTDVPKVLIADDEQACVDFVRQSLSGVACTVVAASDGAEALKTAQEQKPQLIILDVQMPKLNGFEVFARLRADAQFAAVPIVMLTGVAEKTGVGFSGQDMGEYLGSQPDAYIEKPIEPIILRQTVKRLLKGK